MSVGYELVKGAVISRSGVVGLTVTGNDTDALGNLPATFYYANLSGGTVLYSEKPGTARAHLSNVTFMDKVNTIPSLTFDIYDDPDGNPSFLTCDDFKPRLTDDIYLSRNDVIYEGTYHTVLHRYRVISVAREMTEDGIPLAHITCESVAACMLDVPLTLDTSTMVNNKPLFDPSTITDDSGTFAVSSTRFGQACCEAYNNLELGPLPAVFTYQMGIESPSHLAIGKTIYTDTVSNTTAWDGVLQTVNNSNSSGGSGGIAVSYAWMTTSADTEGHPVILLGAPMTAGKNSTLKLGENIAKMESTVDASDVCSSVIPCTDPLKLKDITENYVTYTPRAKFDLSVLMNNYSSGADRMAQSVTRNVLDPYNSKYGTDFILTNRYGVGYAIESPSMVERFGVVVNSLSVQDVLNTDSETASTNYDNIAAFVNAQPSYMLYDWARILARYACDYLRGKVNKYFRPSITISGYDLSVIETDSGHYFDKFGFDLLHTVDVSNSLLGVNTLYYVVSTSRTLDKPWELSVTLGRLRATSLDTQVRSKRSLDTSEQNATPNTGSGYGSNAAQIGNAIAGNSGSVYPNNGTMSSPGVGVSGGGGVSDGWQHKVVNEMPTLLDEKTLYFVVGKDA